MSTPTSRPCNLILAVRPAGGSQNPTLGCFSAVTQKVAVGANEARHSRLGAPPARLRAREWTREEIKSVKLVTKRRSILPLLLIPPNGEGIFLRPTAEGNVVATLPWGFPFARKVVGRVEIANEDRLLRIRHGLDPANRAGRVGRRKAETASGFLGVAAGRRAFRLHELSINP